MARPYAYLRKSSVRDLATSFGPETQEREVRNLARRFGDDGGSLKVLADWDISGAGKYTHKRKAYLELVEDVKAGKASAVYSYSLSRLGRSVQELTRLFDLCAEKGVPIRLVADSVDTSTPSGRMTATVLAAIAQFESEVASERRHAQNETKRARGMSLRTRRRYGEGEGEDPQRVLDTFRETGSYSRTAKLLNEAGLPARSGKQWFATSVRLVVQRLDPTITSQGRAVKTRASFMFARLLRCPYCGTLLTGTTVRKRKREVIRYACSNYAGARHGKVSVSEALVRAAIEPIVRGYHVPTEVKDTSEERQRLDADRLRYVQMFGEGLINKEERDTFLRPILARMRELDATVAASGLPEQVDWSDKPAEVNDRLRKLFQYFTLNHDLVPTAAMPYAGLTYTRWVEGEMPVLQLPADAREVIVAG